MPTFAGAAIGGAILTVVLTVHVKTIFDHALDDLRPCLKFATERPTATGMKSKLTFRWMLKATVDDSAEKLRFEDKVPKARGMDAHIVTPGIIGIDGGRTRYTRDSIYLLDTEDVPPMKWSHNNRAVGLESACRDPEIRENYSAAFAPALFQEET